MKPEYRNIVRRLASEGDWSAAAANYPLSPEVSSLILRNSARVGFFADYVLEADGEPSALDVDTWEAYGPAVALYALWWDVLAARTLRRRTAARRSGETLY